MATVTYGGAIPNKGVNLTMVGDSVLAVNDWVYISGAYACDKPAARGDYGIIGYVIVANSAIGGDVTVATMGNSVETFVAGGTIAAGDALVASTDGKLYAYDPTSSPGAADNCCSIIGWALTAASAAGSFDALIK